MLDIFIEPALADDIKERAGNTIPGVTGPNDEVEHSNVTSVPVSYEPQALSEVEVVNAPSSYIGQIIGGKYRLDRKIGQGGMGEVFLGLNDELGQKVAVKFLSRKFADDEGIVQRFLNEARSYCRVNHPNAVTLLEYGQHEDGTLYIITEFVEGKNLAEHMKDHGFLEFPHIIQVATQVCEVLASAHGEGVIHRDLKPDNLMLSPASRGRYTVKVLDFGIAKIVDEDHDGPNTETGSVFGTPEFMSPEQARGEAADPRSDIYAVGIILFFMLTGKLPFKGKNKLVVLNKQLNEHPPRPTEIRPDANIPLRLEAVVMKCLNKRRDGRYASADDLLDALEELTLPGGERTDKVGVAELSESSEVATASTPAGSLRHSTVRLGADASAELDPLADTMASVEMNRPSISSELESVEMWREQHTTESSLRGRGTSHMSVAVALAIIVILAVVLGATLFGRDGAVESESKVQDILITGQVVGMLSAAEEMVREGGLDAARRSLDKTDLWLTDDELPDNLLEKRASLRDRIEKLTTLRDTFRQAMEDGDCETGEKVAQSVAPLSSGMKQRFERRLGRCGKATQPQPTLPTPNVVAPEPKPETDEVPPPKSDPVVAKKTEPDAVETEAQEHVETPQDQDAKAPDMGMALPPKHL